MGCIGINNKLGVVVGRTGMGIQSKDMHDSFSLENFSTTYSRIFVLIRLVRCNVHAACICSPRSILCLAGRDLGHFVAEPTELLEVQGTFCLLP